MKKIISIFITTTILFGFLSSSVLAETTATSTAQLQQLIQTLQQQIATLQAQLDALKQARSQVQETTKEIKGTLRLIRQLRLGMSGDDVKLLQELLATDSDVYPECLVTGYFGPLTVLAVKRFQQKWGLDLVGNVGPKTLAKINELLQEGAGASGKVPPGLLIAPGIRKKLGFIPQPLPGQLLPPGIAKKFCEYATTTPDVIPPIISAISATSTTVTSTRIVWTTNEKADSKVWYGTSTPLLISTSTPMVSSTNLVLNHDLLLSNLNASTTYYYRVTSADASGNTATSTEKFFLTLPE